MSAVLRLGIASILLLLLTIQVSGQNAECVCDPAQPGTMKSRPCSLCGEAEKQPSTAVTFVLKDISPRKPNRWLALLRDHKPGHHNLSEYTRDLQLLLWQTAADKGRELFGDEWGVAYNGWKVRTQCHVHVHIGRFIRAAENSKFKVVRRLKDIPAPAEDGVFIHPVQNGFHIHTGENIMETALVR